MKWYVFAGFVAALLCCAFWTAVIVFEIITSRLRPDPKGVASVAPLLFSCGQHGNCTERIEDTKPTTRIATRHVSAR